MNASSVGANTVTGAFSLSIAASRGKFIAVGNVLSPALLAATVVSTFPWVCGEAAFTGAGAACLGKFRAATLHPKPEKRSVRAAPLA